MRTHGSGRLPGRAQDRGMDEPGTCKGGCADRRDTQATGVHLMTTAVLPTPAPPTQPETITKVSIIVSRRSLDGGVMTHYLAQKMDKLDIPSIPEFIEMIADTGAGLYACKASVDLFGLTREDFIEQVTDIITVGEFYASAAGGQIIFT
jgi:peroxiredoxin family protein